MGTYYSCQWTPSCMYLLCSFSVPEINSVSNKKGVSELFLTHLFIYTNSANLTSLPQNQHDIPISNLRTRVANITQTRK